LDKTIGNKRTTYLTSNPLPYNNQPEAANNPPHPVQHLHTLGDFMPTPLQLERHHYPKVNTVNNDFHKIIKNFYSRVQINHHIDNWRETPGSIFSKIRDLFDNINPPHPGDSFRTECNNLRDTTNVAINGLVTEHLQNCLVLLDQELKTYNPLDGIKDNPPDGIKALDIATRQPNNMPKLNKTLKAKYLNEGMKLICSQVIEQLNVSMDCHPPPLEHNNNNPIQRLIQLDSYLTSSSAPNKRKRDTSSSPNIDMVTKKSSRCNTELALLSPTLLSDDQQSRFDTSPIDIDPPAIVIINNSIAPLDPDVEGDETLSSGFCTPSSPPPFPLSPLRFPQILFCVVIFCLIQFFLIINYVVNYFVVNYAVLFCNTCSFRTYFLDLTFVIH